MRAVVFTVSPSGIQIKQVDNLTNFMLEPPENVGIHFFTTGPRSLSQDRVRDDLDIASDMWISHFGEHACERD